MESAPPSASDNAEYERHIEFLQSKYRTKKWFLSSILTIILQQTAKQRRFWVKTENPTVKMVLDKFPCLADSKIVSYSWGGVAGQAGRRAGVESPVT